MHGALSLVGFGVVMQCPCRTYAGAQGSKRDFSGKKTLLHQVFRLYVPGDLPSAQARFTARNHQGRCREGGGVQEEVMNALVGDDGASMLQCFRDIEGHEGVRHEDDMTASDIGELYDRRKPTNVSNGLPPAVRPPG